MLRMRAVAVCCLLAVDFGDAFEEIVSDGSSSVAVDLLGEHRG